MCSILKDGFGCSHSRRTQSFGLVIDIQTDATSIGISRADRVPHSGLMTKLMHLNLSFIGSELDT